MKPRFLFAVAAFFIIAYLFSRLGTDRVAKLLVLSLSFLFSAFVGVFQLARPRRAQAWFIRFRSEHPVWGSMAFVSKDFMSSPYYVAFIRVVGAGFLIFAAVALYALYLAAVR